MTDFRTLLTLMASMLVAAILCEGAIVLLRHFHKMLSAEKRILLVDMDGVMNHWEKGTPLSTVLSEGYFRTRKPFWNLLAALDDPRIRSRFKVIAVTNAPKKDIDGNQITWCVDDKNYWLDMFTNIPVENRIFLDYEKDKAAQMREVIPHINGTVYLDDYTVNLNGLKDIPWMTPVKVVNDINDSRGSFEGIRIYNMDTTESIVRALLAL